MKFAISYSTAFNGTDPDRLVAFAQHAERCGFEALYVQDHIALYPGAAYGAGELPPTLPYFDPLDCLSFVAAATQRLLLGTGVLLLPYRHPVVLAKRLATVDVLSKGRMRLLTVGLGTLPGRRRRRVWTSRAGAVVRTRPSMCCGCCGPAARRGSTTAASSSPSTSCAAFRNRLGCANCRFMSVDRVARPPGASACGVTGTSPVAC